MNDDIQKIIEEAQVARAKVMHDLIGAGIRNITSFLKAIPTKISSYFDHIHQKEQDAYLSRATNIAELEDMMRFDKRDPRYY